MRTAEVVTLVLCLAVAFAAGGAVGAHYAPKKPPQTLGSEELFRGRMEELERRVDEQARIRCLHVTTERMDLTIYPVENLGVKKVSKP